MINLKELSRRDFLKICTIVTATMGLPYSMVEKVEAAMKKGPKPTVIWLHFMECTGCTEALLRASHPPIGKLLLDIINLEYHETLMPAAGKQAEEVLHQTMEKYKGKYICIVEGAVSTKDGGIYCKIAGKPAIQILKEVTKDAMLTIAYGTCATFGGVQAASPNPTGAVGVGDVIGKDKVINISGCPPNPYNLLATVSYILVFGKLPALDNLRRPKFAYGTLIHDHCERRGHFDEGRFAEKFGDEGHKKGYCLYKLGCKGPVTYANCPALRFCDVGVWPVSAGHPCIGCTEPNFWDEMAPFYKSLG
ncbi:MAG: Ni/Fe hydrogenase [Thermodesulfobacterium geofontis]|uniref:Ni/Fe hydrogenase n=1 Tax=Thermodesulfobacterium geofontis TaxID=1295609 RepID=A0A2N7PPZ1_9BACT|nr:MAG: Ni/Fe hydrogenase [Fervidicoccus fontis]PMP68426.1 MAG: Ni/Fe hydrogenase [Thermodesulfobacterium geofontis]